MEIEDGNCISMFEETLAKLTTELDASSLTADPSHASLCSRRVDAVVVSSSACTVGAKYGMTVTCSIFESVEDDSVLLRCIQITGLLR